MGGKSGGEARVPHEDANNLNSKQRVRILDLIGEGPLEGVGSLQNVYLNDTPVQSPNGSHYFSGIDIRANRGTANQSPLSGFDSTRRSVPVGAEVVRDRPIVRSVTDPQVDSLLVTVGVQSLVQTTDEGDRLAASVDMLVEIGRGGRWETAQDVHIEGKTTAPYYTDIYLGSLPERPFDIRVSRLSNDQTSERNQDKTVWASYTEIIQSRLSYAHSAVVGLQADSDQFGHSIPRRNYLVKGLIVKVPANYNPATRAYHGLWNGEFKSAWTDNPAWVFYDLVTNERYGLGKQLGVFSCDKWALYQVAQYCDELVDDGMGGREPRMTCNVCISNVREAYELLNDLASAFRGIALWNGQTLTVAQDRHADPVWLYTNANVVGGRFEYSYVGKKAIHSVAHVQYVDKKDGWRSKVEYVEDRELLRRYGENIKRVTAFGCTSRGQAARMGRWLLETAKNEQCTVTFTVGAEGLMHLPYDIIQIADNDYIGALYGGRIQAVSGSLITLDRAVENAVGGTLLSGGRTYTVAAQPAPEQLRLDGDASALTADAVWALSSRQIQPRLFRAVSVEENSEDGTYTIVAVEHWAEKGDAVDKGIRFDRPSGSLLSLKPELSPPTLNIHGKTIEFSWDASYLGGDLSYETKLYRNGVLYREPELSRQPRISFEDLPNGDYEVRIRARTDDGIYSKPVSYWFSINYTITALRTEGRALAIDLTWTLPEIVTRSVHTELWYGKTRERGDAVKLAVLPYPQNRYTLTGVSVTDTYYFWARLADADGMAGGWTDAVVGQADQDPEPVVAQIRGAIEKSSLSQDLIDQLKADDTAAENRAKAAASADAANKVAAEARARGAEIRREAEARAEAVQQETQARNAEIRREADKQTAALRAESGKLNTAIASAAQTARQELAAQVAKLTAKDGELQRAQTALDGKAAELTRTAQQLGNRITAAETVNREQATAIQTITAAHGRTAAALEAEKTARAQGDAAEARAREALAATVGQHTAALSAERQARIDGDAANTRELNTAKSRIADAVSSIGRLEQTVANNSEAAARETRELTARLDNLQVGGRNYVLASDRSTANYLIFAVSPDLTADKLRGQMLTVSCDIVCQGIQAGERNRIGAEIAIEYADGTSAYIGAWRRNTHTAGDFRGRIKISLQLADKPVSRIVSMGIYNQTGGGTATVARPKLEIGNVATDWSPAPEDGATAAEAAITAEREARAEADNALTRELNTAKSRLGNAEVALQTEQRTRAEADRAEAQARQTLAGKVDGNTAAIAAVREAKADKNQVAALVRTSLASEWTAAAQTAAQTAKSQAIQAAAEAAQAKADAAQRAAEQAAERLATAKANAAQAAATAAASGDATAKANAAEARAKADAAAKDEVVKRAAAADAQQKADAARAVAEAAQRAADTVAADLVREQKTRAAGDEANAREITAAKARLGTAESGINELRQTTARQSQALAEAQSSLAARLNNLQVGGRNYVLASDRSTANYLTFAVSPDLTADKLRGQMLTVSCDIVCQGVQAGDRNRIGAEIAIEYADGTSAYIGAWRRNTHTAGDFKGRIKISLQLADKPVNRIVSMGIYNQTGGGTATVARPKLEIGNVATDWSPAPEDNDAATAAVAAELTAYKKAQATTDAAQTAELQAAKSQIGQQTAALEQIRSTKADKSEVSAQLQTTLQAAARDAQSKADAAKTAAERTAQTKAAEAQAAAERAAQAKADAAKAQAIAAASGDATAKANAVKAQADADAAAKDAVIKREAAADAQAKADAAKNAAIGEARQLNTAANARINTLENTVANNREAAAQETRELTARIDGLQVGGRNYVLASDRSTANYLTFAVSPDLLPETLRGQTLTVSCDIVCQGIQAGERNRIGAEITVEYADGSRAYVGAWRNNAHTAGNFKGRISGSLKLADKPVRQIHALGIYNQTGGGTSTVARPKLEIGSVATDWSPAPEDGATAAQIQAVQSALAEKDRAQTERADTLTAKIGAAESTVRSTQTAVTALSGKVQAMHTVKVQAVGNRKAVAGLALGADGATGDSQFLVMADKFGLVAPDSTEVKAPFVVVQQHGRAQLALSGDMIADGLIHGKHIAAGQTLQAPVINGGSLNIGYGRFAVNSSGQVSISSGNGNVGLRISNERIVVYDNYGTMQVCMGLRP